MVLFDEIVAVPGLHVAMVTLHHAHAAFDQAARDEKLARLHGVAIRLADMNRFLRHVEGISGFELHPVGEFKGLDAGLELRIVAAGALVFGVELGQ